MLLADDICHLSLSPQPQPYCLAASHEEYATWISSPFLLFSSAYSSFLLSLSLSAATIAMHRYKPLASASGPAPSPAPAADVGSQPPIRPGRRRDKPQMSCNSCRQKKYVPRRDDGMSTACRAALMRSSSPCCQGSLPINRSMIQAEMQSS